MGHTPFRYQATEWDCVPTTFVNGLSLLFKREEIPPEVIQRMYLYGLDFISPRQHQGRGTTKEAVKLLCTWLWAKEHNSFSVYVKRKSGKKVRLAKDSKLTRHLQEENPALLSVISTNEERHYILAMAIVDGWVYGFDPYPKLRSSQPGAVEWDEDETFRSHVPLRLKKGQVPNVRIHASRLDAETGLYCLGKPSEREVVLMANAAS